MCNRQSHHNLRIGFQLRYCSFCKLCPRGIVEHNLDVGKVGQARICHLHVIFSKFTGCYFFGPAILVSSASVSNILSTVMLSRCTSIPPAVVPTKLCAHICCS